MGTRSVLLMLGIMILLAACSAGAANTPVPGNNLLDQLPAVSELDLVRPASAVDNHIVPLNSYLQELFTANAGAQLVFNPGQPRMAYAIYRIDPPGDELLTVTINGEGALWLTTADYGRGHWDHATPLSSGQAVVDITAMDDNISPAGFFYFAVVLAKDESTTETHALDAITISYEDGMGNGATYYVAPAADGGSDANPGTEAEPWLTLQHAADTVEAGDRVLVQPGTYTGFHLQTSGYEGEPITFDGQGVATINWNNPNTPDCINLEDWGAGSIHHVIIQGFTVTNGVRAGIRFSGSVDEHAHHITIRNNLCTQNGVWGIFCGFNDDIVVEGNECSYSGSEHGIYLSNSCKRYVLRRNICHDNHGCGIHNNGDLAMGGDGIMRWGIIEYNTCYYNGAGGGSALNFDTAQDCIIRGNLCYGNDSSGISLYSVSGIGSKRNYVLNNTVIQPNGSRFCLNIKTGSTDNVALNNCFYNFNTSYRGIVDITTDCLSGFVCDYNTVMDRFVIDDGSSLTLSQWQAQTGQDMHSILAAPNELFVNYGVLDFRLKAGSPAISAGTGSQGGPEPVPPVDFDGTPRPSGMGMDIGAYEYTGPE